MKLAGSRALAWCEKPKDAVDAVLLFGPDSGLVSAAADMLARARIPDLDPMNLIRMTEEDLRRDDARLADELVARSLLGGARLVRLRIDREASARSALETLADLEAGRLRPEAFWIVEGGDLPKTSKMRKAFEDAGKAMALQLHADDEATVSDYASKRLAASGVAIDPDALAALVDELPGDRRLAMSELEKLELFAFELGRPVSLADVRAIAAAEQARGADEAADAAILGQVEEADRAIQRFLDAGGSAVSAMRVLHFRMMRMMDAVSSSAGTGMRLRPPVFDKEWPAYSRAMRDWPAARLQRAFDRLYQAEKSCKQAGAPTDAIVSSLILRVARRSL